MVFFYKSRNITPSTRSRHRFSAQLPVPPVETDLWWPVLCTATHQLNKASLYRLNRKRNIIIFDSVENLYFLVHRFILKLSKPTLAFTKGPSPNPQLFIFV